MAHFKKVLIIIIVRKGVFNETMSSLKSKLIKC